MHTGTNAPTPEVESFLRRFAANPEFVGELAKYLDLLEAGTWVAGAIATTVEQSVALGHIEFSKDPDNVRKEVEWGYLQHLTSIRAALTLQRAYPEPFAEPEAWLKAHAGEFPELH